MPYTSITPAKRVEVALSMMAPLDRMPDLLTELRCAEIRHAQTDAADDYLNVLQLRAEYIQITADALGFNLDEELMWLAEEARRECGYDLHRMEHISRPEPCVSFGFSHPDSGRGFRVGGAA